MKKECYERGKGDFFKKAKKRANSINVCGVESNGFVSETWGADAMEGKMEACR